MQYRVSLDFIGTGRAAKAYGGKLNAWSFVDIEPQEWFERLRNTVLANLGKSYLPIYRMADGEYRFLMGRKFNRHRKPLFKEYMGYLADKTGLRNPHKWSTSWGESYSPSQVKNLKSKYISELQQIASEGFLALYLNDNGLNAFIEYNDSICPFFEREKIRLAQNNYIPFHFVCHLMSGDGWEDFYENRHILIVTSLNPQKRQNIENTLKLLGVKSVQFIEISSSQSMQDVIDCSTIERPVDLALVAAGIGSSNILVQLKSLQTVVLDIGGFMNCLEDPSRSIHGGVFKLPKLSMKVSMND
jgi:hypothetical protein